MAAGSTYTPIQTITASGTPTSVTFSSIPSTYTDLVLVCSFQNTATVTTGDLRILMYFNGTTGTTNYSSTQIWGDSSTAQTGRNTNRGGIDNIFQSATANTGEFGTMIYNIMNYANTTTYKSVVFRQGTVNSQLNGYGAGAAVGLWRSTAAISSITLLNRVSSELWSNGSTFTLYGIAAA
jgi:hypothetical protein